MAASGSVWAHECIFLDERHLLWGDVCGYIWAAAFGGSFPPKRALVRVITELKYLSLTSARSKPTMECWTILITSFCFKPILKLTQNILLVFSITYKPSALISGLPLFGTEQVRQSLTRTERLLTIPQYWTIAIFLATDLSSVCPQRSRTKSCGSGKFARPGFLAQNFSRQMFGYKLSDS